MNLTINSVRFDADKKLEDYISSKVQKLQQVSTDIIGVEVFLKLENKQKVKEKVAEIKVELPGNDLFVKKQSKSFEESADVAVDALRRQLQKHKSKTRTK